jgi:hypothetical protein
LNKESLQELKKKKQNTQNDVMDSWASKNVEKELKINTRKATKDLKNQIKQNANKLGIDVQQNDPDKYIIFNKKLISDFNAVVDQLNKQHKNDLGMMWSTNSVDYLAYYTNIGYRIRDVIEIIGTKDKNLVKNIGNVCEIQCSNKSIA